MSTEPLGFLHLSDVETRRFGLRIARGVVPPGAASDSVLHGIRSLRPEVAIFRCNAGDTAQIGTLVSAGLVPLHADTLVYHEATLRARPTRVSAPEPIRLGQAGDAVELSDIVRRSFSTYRNHYHANPLLSPQAILEGYVEWALGYAVNPEPHQQTWVHCADGQVRSFATCRVETATGIVEVVLNATDPAWSGRGLYSRLLGFLLDHYGTMGLRRLVISTQIWNYGVQRVWARSGLVIERAYDTYHINVPRGFAAEERL